MSRHEDDSDYIDGLERLSDGIEIGEIIFWAAVHLFWLALVVFLLFSPWITWKALQERNWKDVGMGVLSLLWCGGCLAWWYIDYPKYFTTVATRMMVLITIMGALAVAANAFDAWSAKTKKG